VRRVRAGRRASIALVATAGTCVAALAALHAPFARTVLARIGGCPVGRASAAEIEAARKSAAAPNRGERDAPARPAAGFALDVTTRADVDAWARSHGVSCREKRERALLACADVPARALDARWRRATVKPWPR